MQVFSGARRSGLVALLCAGGFVLGAAPGHAQQAASGQGSQGWLFDLSGLGQGVGAALADKGIYLNGHYMGEGLSEVGGGRKQGSFYESYTTAGADFDMGKIVGIEGGAVHFVVSDIAGQSYAGYSGSDFSYNRDWGYGPGVRLNELSWDQELFDNRVRILAGRIDTETDFDTMAVQCQLLTTTCSAPAGYIMDKSGVAFNSSSWGATATLKPSKPTYFKFGVYEDEGILADENQLAWPGRDWDFQSSTGALIPVEMGYRTTAQNDLYPKIYDIGGFYDTASYADPLLNTAGGSHVLKGGASKEDIGRSQVYFQAQQMVYRHDPGSDRGLTLFAAGNWATSGEAEIENDVVLGVYAKGMFDVRPNDTLTFGATLIGINHRITERIDQTIVKQGGSGHVGSEEGVLEVDYGIALAPGITLTPMLQYVAHPDQYLNPTPSGDMNYSLMVGTWLMFNFNSAFGLPQMLRGTY
ncbi:MAG TPA: carbohydrate porin [Rhodopila sp.]|nr:carbohydrate porin [Rhodopila sp.]